MDLSTSYLGLRLQNPFIAGASPMAAHLDTVSRLEDAGCAAIVMHSLFEEQITMASTGRIRHRDPLDSRVRRRAGAVSSDAGVRAGPDEYLEHVRRVKQPSRFR